MSLAQRENRANLLAWLGSLMFAAVGVVSGGLLALVSLVAQPVAVVKEKPAEADAGPLYYLPGDKDSTRGKLWSLKRRNLIQGPAGIVTLSEEELNSWFALVARTELPRNPNEPPPDVVMEGINFRATRGMLQVALPITYNGFSDPMRVIVQARGQVVPGEGRWFYRPDEVWLGSLPLHRIPGAVDYLVAKQLDESWLTPEALTAWKRIAEVVVNDKSVQVRVQ